MLRIVLTLLLPVFLFATSFSFAQVRADVAEDLLRKCGLWEQLSSVEPQAQAGFAQAMSGVEPKPSAAATERLATVIRASYAPSRLRATALQVVAEGLADQHVDALRRWYTSPAGVAITRAEEDSNRAKSPRRALRFSRKAPSDDVN